MRYMLLIITCCTSIMLSTNARCQTLEGRPYDPAKDPDVDMYMGRGRYPMIGKSWRSNWPRVIPFFAYSAEIRKAIYTTNAIESLNNSLRKVTKNRNSFPSDEAAIKLLYMALKNIKKKLTMPIRNWSLAIHQFSIHFEGRIRI